MTHAGSEHLLFVVWDLIESMGHNEYQNQIKKILCLDDFCSTTAPPNCKIQKKLRTWTIYDNNKRKINPIPNYQTGSKIAL